MQEMSECIFEMSDSLGAVTRLTLHSTITVVISTSTMEGNNSGATDHEPHDHGGVPPPLSVSTLGFMPLFEVDFGASDNVQHAATQPQPEAPSLDLGFGSGGELQPPPLHSVLPELATMPHDPSGTAMTPYHHPSGAAMMPYHHPSGEAMMPYHH